MKWTDEAATELRRIRLRYNVTEAKVQQLRRIAEDWALRRIAGANEHGYDDDPRAVMASDVGYSWGYMQICEGW